MFHTYILKSKINNNYYIGSCNDLSKRIKLHNSGLVRSTKRYLPWTLIYSENFENLSSARKREGQIKSWKSRKMIKKLIEHYKI